MDIYSISNLLEALAQQENELLKASGISHRPTIGNMDEGLTADIVNNTGRLSNWFQGSWLNCKRENDKPVFF